MDFSFVYAISARVTWYDLSATILLTLFDAYLIALKFTQ